ncbi:MAG TPA: serine hydrolase domain-containing protein [Kofleriaceae bacterium]|nr:serine hydrolase domain-containing protein [Kofleriaceae bacterium]
MRSLVAFTLFAVACGGARPKQTVPAPPATGGDTTAAAQPPAPTPEPAAQPPEPTPEMIGADTPKATVAGNTFVAPAGWSMIVRGTATVLTPPEGDSHIALVDVNAKNADQAVKLAWIAYDPTKKYELKVATPAAPHDGWQEIQGYDYFVSPNEKRGVGADARFANGQWLVTIYDMTNAVGEKRSSQVGVIFGKLLPKGYERETFAGKKANELTPERIKALGAFVEASEKLLGVPGVSIGVIQNGKTVFIGGFGVRELGKPAKVDGDTKYMVASNTKAMTTLMLAKLVDEKKLTWDSTATSLLPSFKLGDADTTSKVMVKHLICACTGLPRQDMEWLLEYGKLTPEGALATLGTMQPTSKFGELYQYSNPLAAAAGFLGGHVAFPKLELGKAYDQAMQARVFGPLGMKDTTFDFKKAEKGNSAVPHSPDVDGKTALALKEVNYSIIPVRPAGAAWSTVRDMLKYVQMELAEGKLPNGKQYVSKDALLARRAPQVAIGKDATYGMGLMVDTKYDVTVVHHGGDMIGFHSDMMWIPDAQVGAVILTNGDPGWLIRNQFRRKLLEVLYDGKPEADANISAAAKQWFDGLAAERKLMTIPADSGESGRLAQSYSNDALGTVTVSKAGAATVFDFGEWKSEVASRKNPDGSISFLTTVPGMSGLELVVGNAGGKRTLVLRDGQHEYVFTEK